MRPYCSQVRALRGRILRLGLGAVLVVAILIVAQQDLASTVLAVAGLGIAALLWLGLRRPYVAAALVSFVVTCVAVSGITHWIGSQLASTGPAQVGLVFWIFAFVVVAATWFAQGVGRSSALTIALGHAILIAASFAAYIQTAVVPVLALVAAMTVVTGLAWRRRRKIRLGLDELALEPLPRNALLRSADRTREALVDLDARVVGPVRLRDLEIEHVVLMGDRIVVVETRQWEGKVERVRLASKGKTVGEAYGLDSDVHELAARTEPVVRAALAFARQFGLAVGNVVAVVALWDNVDLGEPVVEMRASEPNLTRKQALPVTYLVRGDHLAEWVRSLD